MQPILQSLAQRLLEIYVDSQMYFYKLLVAVQSIYHAILDILILKSGMVFEI